MRFPLPELLRGREYSEYRKVRVLGGKVRVELDVRANKIGHLVLALPSTILPVCSMHKGESSSQESREFVSISIFPPTLVATATMLCIGIQPLRGGPCLGLDVLSL